MSKKLLITGGSGFLGKQLALALKNDYEVCITGRNNKRLQEAQKLTECECRPMDVSSIESIRDVFNDVKPHIIIHAAATKFVPLAEIYPMECVDINIHGSQNVARVAIDQSIPIVIGISTDKASPPVQSMYGLSKAVMERLFCNIDGKTETYFTCVRYGNVAWSTGSVLPIWKERSLKQESLNVTEPNMYRFFFTVNEAVELVLTALNNILDVHGKILTQEMKAASLLRILTTWQKNKGCHYNVTGSRPGERIVEYLIGNTEIDNTEKIMFQNNIIPHYLIHPNQKVKQPLLNIISSENTTQLTDGEILNLINHKSQNFS